MEPPGRIEALHEVMIVEGARCSAFGNATVIAPLDVATLLQDFNAALYGGGRDVQRLCDGRNTRPAFPFGTGTTDKVGVDHEGVGMGLNVLLNPILIFIELFLVAFSATF